MRKLFAGDENNEPVSTFRLMAGLFLLCLSVRGFLALNTVVVGGDATSFLWGVRNLGMGPPYDALVKDKLLFQLITYGVEPYFGDPILAGKAVTVFFSSLTVVFLYPLFHDYFSPSVAVLAVLLYILHPTINDEHTKIITDGTFTCFFIGAVFLFHRYFYTREQWKEWGYLVGSFVLSGLAVATRPEGALLFLIHTSAMLVLVFQAWRDGSVKWSALTGLVLYVLLPFAAGLYFLGDPFLNMLTHPGEYSQNVANMFAVLTGEASVNPLRKWPWYSEAIDEFQELSYYHLNLFLVLGIFATSWKPFPRERTLYLSYVVLYYVAVILAALGNPDSDYINERYLMIGFILLLPLVAGGIAWTYNGIRKSWNRPNTALVVLAVVLTALLPRTLEKGVVPRNTKDIGLKKAGEWIRDQSGDEQPRILSTTKKAAYYAGVDKSRVERVRHLRHDKLDRLLESTSADYLVFSEKYLDRYSALNEVSGHKNLTLLHKYGKGHKTIHTTYVYGITKSVEKE